MSKSIREIINSVDLLKLVGETIALRKEGCCRWVGECPFHGNGSKEAFAVYADHYYCRDCKAHGDAATFIRETQGTSLAKALAYLATRES